MPILDAALAFALTMLVVATVVTQIVRLLRNTAKLRNAELQKMLTEYFDKEARPVIEREVNRLKRKLTDGVADKLTTTANNLSESELFGGDELATLVSVSTDELTERLKRSGLGQEMLTELGDEARGVFDELGRRYEIVGDRFTESFRKYSRRWATVVALLLAVAFNMDGVRIADSYIRNEAMRQGVIAQSEAFAENYHALVASLDEENGNSPITKEDLEQAWRDSQEDLDALSSLDLLIGWSYFPHSGFQEGESKDFQRRNNIGGWAMWVVGIIITGVLAGLGAPFWYDVATGVSRVVQQERPVRKPRE
ncbi:MAG: hypothetical protein ABIK65_11395 [Candidatus Eisenbacteria bacterium]